MNSGFVCNWFTGGTLLMDGWHPDAVSVIGWNVQPDAYTMAGGYVLAFAYPFLLNSFQSCIHLLFCGRLRYMVIGSDGLFLFYYFSILLAGHGTRLHIAGG